VLTVLHGTGAATRQRVQTTIDRISETLATVLEQARGDDRPPAEVARALGRQRVSQASPAPG